jgi:WD40 repeat protein/mono/diheme cytochrome c family protein
MNRPVFLWLTLFPLIAGPLTLDARGDDDAARDPAAQLWAAFSQNCIACHNAKKAEGGLNLEDHQRLMAGGDSGPSIMANDPESSYLLERVISDDDPMPPKGNAVGARRFTPEEVALLKTWIADGAPAPDALGTGTTQTVWQSLPASLQPAYAMAASRDGNYLAFGRGGHAILVDQRLPSMNQAVVLSDPKLADLTPASALQPPAHLDFVNALACSPDSQRVATGGYRCVKIWARESTPSTVLEGLGSSAGPTALSPSGAWLARAIPPRGVELTAVAQGLSYRWLSAHAAEVTAMVWLDENQLLSCDQSGGALLLDAATQQMTPVEAPASVLLSHMCAIGDRNLLALGKNNDLHLGELRSEATGAYRLELQPLLEGEQVTALAVHRGAATQAVLGLADGRLKVLSLPDAQWVAEHRTDMPAKSLAISIDGSLLAMLPQTGPARLVSLADGSPLATLDQDYNRVFQLDELERAIARQQNLSDRLAASIPELKKLVEQEAAATKSIQEARDKAAESLQAQVTAVDGAMAEIGQAESALAEAQAAVAEAMKVVEARTAELEAKRKAMAEAEQQKLAANEELAKKEQALATAKDGLAVAESKIPEMEQRVGSEQERLAELQQQQVQLQAEPSTIAVPRQVVALADAQQLAIAYDDHIRLFAASDGRPLGYYTLTASIQQLLRAPTALLGLTTDGTLLRWPSAGSWRLEHTLGDVDQTLFSDRITALCFSPDGRQLAVGSGPASRFGEIKLVDIATGQITRDFGEVHSDTVLSLAFSPDGRSLASGGADKLCRIFNMDSGTSIRALEGHTHHVLAVAWRDDGQVLVTASADASLKVWEFETAVQLRTIGGFSKEVTAVQFVGQGSEFVLASADGTARLYNADNGQLVRQYGGARNALYAVAVSPEREKLFSAGQTGHVYHWRLSDGQLVNTLVEASTD